MAATSGGYIVYVYLLCVRLYAIQAIEVVDRQKLPSYALSVAFLPIRELSMFTLLSAIWSMCTKCDALFLKRCRQ